MTRWTNLLLVAALSTGCAAKKIDALEAELATRDAELAELEATHAGCVVQADTLRAEIRKLQRKNEELAAYYQDLLDEFGGAMEEGDVELVLYPDRSTLALSEEIHFATGSARLTGEGQRAVDELAALLERHSGRRFQVEGHTDPRPIAGSYAANWELGAARAITVVKGLIDRGVPERQLSAATYAATAPVADNDDARGMAENRRVAVALQTTLEETAAHAALYERAKQANAARQVGDHDAGRQASAPASEEDRSAGETVAGR